MSAIGVRIPSRIFGAQPIFSGIADAEMWRRMVRFVIKNSTAPDIAGPWRDWTMSTFPGWIPPPNEGAASLELCRLWHRAAETILDAHARALPCPADHLHAEDVALQTTLKRIVLQQLKHGDVLGAAQIYAEMLSWLSVAARQGYIDPAAARAASAHIRDGHTSRDGGRG